tara:strand:+ start:114 stop:425 length:312 start_codon:yes stop_codon:yes gene_type:complete
MKRFNLHFIFIFALFASCSSVKESMGSKQNNSDEFLVEKKSPLLMPPDFDELPIPNSENTKSINESSELKELITTSENTNDNSDNFDNSKSSFEKLLIEKIKN